MSTAIAATVMAAATTVIDARWQAAATVARASIACSSALGSTPSTNAATAATATQFACLLRQPALLPVDFAAAQTLITRRLLAALGLKGSVGDDGGSMSRCTAAAGGFLHQTETVINVVATLAVNRWHPKTASLASGLALLALWAGLAPMPALAGEGASLYAQNCMQCHGPNREGGLGPNLTGAKWIKVEPKQASLAKFISQGSSDGRMPGWSKRMTQKQIAAVADYLLTPPAPLKAVDQATVATAEPYPELKNFRLPVGFEITVYSDQVKSARGMAVADSGIVYVASRTEGKVFALVDSGGGKRRADKVVTVATGLDKPIGLTLLNGSLFVSERFRVIRFDDIASTYDKAPPLHVVKDDFPKDAWHGEKIIKAGPDGKLYVPIGAPCNSCNREQEPHTKIHRMNADGSQFEVYARGVRNSVGFGWHPLSREFWFTDNGRDQLGDNLPSDKLNHAPKAGMHFGFPYCQGGVVPDPEFQAGRQCSEFTEPAAKLGPHVASLGMHFYTGQQFPAQYKNQIFIAEHGSWNRSQKIGYRVALITLVGDEVASDTVFVEGFLQNDKVIGRPVDIAQLPDGSMLISDDFAGRIYRVSYAAAPPAAAAKK